MLRNTLLVIVVIFAVFMVITKNTNWMPVFVILLGVAIVPEAVKELKSSDENRDELGAYINITVFGILLVYFLFLMFSGQMY